MPNPDPRDALFAQLVAAHLHPLGFRRRGRQAQRTLADGLWQRVELESSSWNSGSRRDFGINVQAGHPAFRIDPFSDRPPGPSGDLLINLSLRRQADPPEQRWSFDGGLDSANDPMADLTGIEALCKPFGPVRWFEARAWCLRRLGRQADALQVVQAALANAPHDGVRDHAARLLRRYGDG